MYTYYVIDLIMNSITLNIEITIFHVNYVNIVLIKYVNKVT